MTPSWLSVLPGGDNSGQCHLQGCLTPWVLWGASAPCCCLANPHSPQASQLGVYKAFVDNYKIALETAEKCSQSNYQFQKISEVSWDGAVPVGQGCAGLSLHRAGNTDRVCPVEMLSLPWRLTGTVPKGWASEGCAFGHCRRLSPPCASSGWA